MDFWKPFPSSGHDVKHNQMELSSFNVKEDSLDASSSIHGAIKKIHLRMPDEFEELVIPNNVNFESKSCEKHSKIVRAKKAASNSTRPHNISDCDNPNCESQTNSNEHRQYDDNKFMPTCSPECIKTKLNESLSTEDEPQLSLKNKGDGACSTTVNSALCENLQEIEKKMKQREKGFEKAQKKYYLETENVDVKEPDKTTCKPKSDQFIHKPPPVGALMHMELCFHIAFSSLFTQVNKSFEAVVHEFYGRFKQTCYNVFHFKDEEAAKDEVARNGFIACYIVGFFSPAQIKSWIKNLSLRSDCIDEDVISICCCLLNPQNSYIKKYSDNQDASVKVKRKLFKKFLDNLFKDYISNTMRDPARLFFLYNCALELSHDKLLSSIEKLSHFHESKVFSWPVAADGSIYDRARDPPGQRSVYIPPGDPAAESYRLSTYIKFPKASPVSSRKLAAAGFFYTGYKDRVKCFSCSLCVENWVQGDDELHSRWHRSNCRMMLKLDCGNIAIGSIFSQFGARNNRPGGQPATEAPRASAAPNPAPPPSQENLSSIPAGMLLKHGMSTSSSATAYPQTARPVNPPQQVRQNYPRLELATITTSSHEQLLRSLSLQRESDRLRSFATWPVENISVHPSELARSGFFYLGNLDRVQCFSCSGVLRNWNYGDDVHVEHQRHYPNCRMACDTEDRNVVLQPNEQVPIPPRRERMQAPPDPSEEEQRSLREMFPCMYPVNPHMRSEESRHETFDSRWPSSRIQATSRQISGAGFFFLGERDRVKCWYCNGGLQNWDPEDEPWTEHAKWFPTCEFLLQRKGPDFVHQMVSMFPRLPRPMLRGPFDVAPSLGRSSSGQQRRPSPPPPIIDPRAEMHRVQEQLATAMSSNWATTAQEMGFSRSQIERVVKRKLETGGSMYSSVNELMEDLTTPPTTEPSDDEENMNSTESSLGMNSTAVKLTNTETSTLLGSTSARAAPVVASGGAEASTASGNESHMETAMSLPEGMPPSMEERIRELQDERKCKICLDNLADVVFVPCGHLCSCTNCAQALRKCPICREKIEKAIRTYIS